MFSTTTFGIKVTVIPLYDVKNSFPLENRYVFQYNVVVENLGKYPIRILRRRWLIYDLGFGFSEVAGDGVIGLTPEILPGENFAYFSNVILASGIGNMEGVYYCENPFTHEELEIKVPKFNLVTQILYN